MGDQNEIGSGRRLRDVLGISPDGRQILHWSGLDRTADLAALAMRSPQQSPGCVTAKGRSAGWRMAKLPALTWLLFAASSTSTSAASES